MRRSFTMIEIVFVIVIISLLASIGIRKFIVSKDEAKAVTVGKDILTIRDAIMTYYYSHDDSLNAISQVVQYNKKIWNDTDPKKLVFEANDANCVSIGIVKDGYEEYLKIDVDESNLSRVCNMVRQIGVTDYQYTLR